MSKISALFFSVALASGSLISTVALANDIENGKMLFSSTAKPIACAVCHTLQEAGAMGTIGPDLDELKPDADRIRKTMIEGIGAMPSFAESLSETEREDIIQFVVQATN